MRTGMPAAATAAATRHCGEAISARSNRCARTRRIARTNGPKGPLGRPGASSQNGSAAVVQDTSGNRCAMPAVYALHHRPIIASGNRDLIAGGSADANTRSPRLSSDTRSILSTVMHRHSIDRLTVVHVDTERGWRGGQRQALWLAGALEDLGVRSVLVARPGEPLAARAQAMGLDVHPLR